MRNGIKVFIWAAEKFLDKPRLIFYDIWVCRAVRLKSEGDIITIEKLGVEAGEKVTFDQVIAVSDNGLKLGDAVANATVDASVVKEGRGKKIIVYKYKRKTGYHKKQGHRQSFTQVKIEKINA